MDKPKTFRRQYSKESEEVNRHESTEKQKNSSWINKGINILSSMLDLIKMNLWDPKN